MGRWTLFRVRAALILATAAAILSFVTGVVNISATAVGGPLGDVIPPAIQRTAGFTGTFTGFLLLVSAYGLQRRLRLAWISAVVLLPVAAVQGLAQSSAYSLPLVVVSLLALPALLLNRDVFDREAAFSTIQLAAMSALVGSLVYTTTGAFALRDEFDGLESLFDAFYFAVVTSSTVGYGDITPTTQIAKLFAVSALVLGTAAFAVALGSLLGPALQARLERALGTMNESSLTLLDDHVIVVGYGDLTEPIIEELDAVPFVVIVRDTETAQRLRQRDYPVLTGDPTDDRPLTEAGIERAKALLAATDDDAQDALAILAARELNPQLRVVGAATDRENITKLRRAGADTVLSPAVIGSHLLVQSALGREDVEEFADHILTAEGDRTVPEDGG